MRRADREVRGRIEARAQEATRRAQEAVKRVEKGEVQSRPLPGVREDSMEAMESMESMGYTPSWNPWSRSSMRAGVSKGAAGGANMQEDTPLQGVMPVDPAQAEEDLAQRVTEDTGAGGYPHLHNERKADEMTKEMTEDTGAGGDMNLHAERKVNEMKNRMFQD